MNAAASRIVVLASGRGSNLAALAEACVRGEVPGRVVAVLSDRSDAGALSVGRECGAASETLLPRAYVDREAHDAALADRVAAFEPDVIVLAGYMRILSTQFVERFLGRLLNIHPSLLPRYPGLHTHRRVLEAREQVHGCTVHFVIPALDAGPGILQGRLPVVPGDTEATLSARVQVLEHRIYPRAIAWFLAGRVRYRDGAAWLDGARLQGPLVEDSP